MFCAFQIRNKIQFAIYNFSNIITNTVYFCDVISTQVLMPQLVEAVPKVKLLDLAIKFKSAQKVVNDRP